MKSDVTKFLKNLLHKFPFLENLIKRGVHPWRYRDEKRLIEGNLQNDITHPSIIHFSFTKAATQYVKSILKTCAEREGLIHVGLNEYAFHTKFPFLDHLSEEELKQYEYLFKPTGFLYSVFGGALNYIPNAHKYKIVLVTRDPRDILVSEFYSLRYSHPEPVKGSSKRERFLEKRSRARNMGIDEYVRHASDRLLTKFEAYEAFLLNRYNDVYLTKYEEMVADFPQWLDALLDYCELYPGDKTVNKLIEEHEQKKPKRENIHQHRRKGEPGDYQQKLEPDTVKYLNRKFFQVLKPFGYTIADNK